MHCIKVEIGFAETRHFYWSIDVTIAKFSSLSEANYFYQGKKNEFIYIYIYIYIYPLYVNITEIGSRAADSKDWDRSQIQILRVLGVRVWIFLYFSHSKILYGFLDFIYHKNDVT